MKNLDKKRWVVLVASCLINLCIGSIYAWSVFSAPLAAKLTELLGRPFTAADLAIVFTVANAVGPVTMISGGFINDKLGPKWVILVGGGMFGLGMILSGLATSLTGLIVSYGLVLGLGLGMAYGATISNSVKFFPDKKGRTSAPLRTSPAWASPSWLLSWSAVSSSRSARSATPRRAMSPRPAPCAAVRRTRIGRECSPTRSSTSSL